MRMLTTTAILATLTTLTLGVPAMAQSPAVPPGEALPDARSADTIDAVTVVDIDELAPPARAQVDAAVAQASPEEMQALRNSIDATPVMTLALEAKGLRSWQVVAVNVDSTGKLFLITKSEI